MDKVAECAHIPLKSVFVKATALHQCLMLPQKGYCISKPCKHCDRQGKHLQAVADDAWTHDA